MMSGRDYSDETLMAYADGELPPDLMAEIDAVVARDPVVADRIAAFVDTRRLVRESFVSQAPVPDVLRTSVEAMVRRASEAAEPPPRQLSAANSNLRWTLPRVAAAAVIAALAAGVGGFVAGGLNRQDEPLLAVAAPANPEISGHLSTARAGEKVPLSGSAGEMEVIATFVAGEATCREFEIDRAGIGTNLAVACLSEGKWTTTFAMRRAGNGDEFLPASSTEAVDAYLGSISAGSAFDQEQEAAFLATLDPQRR